MKYLIVGSKGMLGRALIKEIEIAGDTTYGISRNDADLCNFDQTLAAMSLYNDADCVILSAAKVGGITSNLKYPVQYGEENVLISINVLKSAYMLGIKNLIVLGSSCIYPRNCPQPMKEEYLLNGHFEPTNEMYGLAKCFAIKLGESYNKQYGTNFQSIQPPNLYGENDNFDPTNSHVVAALLRKFHLAKVTGNPVVECWGDGSAMREIMHVTDAANGVIFCSKNLGKINSFINIGTGEDMTIKELSELVKEVVGYTGNIVWDSTKPNGMPRKVMDVSRIHSLGWKHKIGLRDGLIMTYNWAISKGAF